MHTDPVITHGNVQSLDTVSGVAAVSAGEQNSCCLDNSWRWNVRACCREEDISPECAGIPLLALFKAKQQSVDDPHQLQHACYAVIDLLPAACISNERVFEAVITETAPNVFHPIQKGDVSSLQHRQSIPPGKKQLANWMPT